MKCSNLLKSRLRLHINAIAVQLHVTRDLKVILLLTDESVVRVGKVKSFVGVDAEMWNGSERGGKKKKMMINIVIAFRKVHSQLLMIVIQQRVPLMLLKQTESNALNLRSIRAAVVSLCHRIIRVVAAFILVIFLKRLA